MGSFTYSLTIIAMFILNKSFNPCAVELTLFSILIFSLNVLEITEGHLYRLREYNKIIE